jgi:hypothetical protein
LIKNPYSLHHFFILSCFPSLFLSPLSLSPLFLPHADQVQHFLAKISGNEGKVEVSRSSEKKSSGNANKDATTTGAQCSTDSNGTSGRFSRRHAGGQCVPANSSSSSSHRERRIFTYSREKALLEMSEDKWVGRQLSFVDLYVNEERCFAGAWYAHYVLDLVGHKTLLMAWASDTFGSQGFLSDQATRSIWSLGNARDEGNEEGKQAQVQAQAQDAVGFGPAGDAQKDGGGGYLWPFAVGDTLVQWAGRVSSVGASKASILLKCLLLFFVTDSIVSSTLRETQNRMIKFTFLLQVRKRLPLYLFFSWLQF